MLNMYQGTRTERRAREIRLLQERLVRFLAHPLYESDRGTFARLAAEAVRERLRALGTEQRREYL
jgi:hypothetical protein